MSHNHQITGSLVAIVTPMFSDGSLDWESLRQLIDYHIEHGTHGIVAVGTTGESATLDFDEHRQVLECIVKKVDQRIPVIAGTGANSTTEAIELTLAAQDIGADACLLVTPYYNKPTQEGLYQHHKMIAEAASIPQILYNVPGRTACDMLPDTVARLAKIDNIIGIKEATGDIERGREIIVNCGSDFLLYSGDDETALELIKVGAVGTISVTANIAPHLLALMCESITQGKIEQADQLNQQLMPLHQKLFVEANPIPVKWALHKMGLINEGIRLPLTWLSDDKQPVVEGALQEAGIL